MTAGTSTPTAQLDRAERASLELKAALTNLGLRTRHLSVHPDTGTGPVVVILRVDSASADAIARILAAHAAQADQ